MAGAWLLAALAAFVPARVVQPVDDETVDDAVLDVDDTAPALDRDPKPQLKFLLIPHATFARFVEIGRASCRERV